MKDDGGNSLRAYVCAAVRDARRIDARPGVVVVRGGRIVAAGELDRLAGRYLKRAEVVELPDRLLMPAMVNAHAHLDLTTLGPCGYDGDFPAWLKRVTRERPTTSEGVAEAVQRGVALSREAGVEWIGDIAYSADAIAARRATGIPGISYLEAFGLGARQADRVAALRTRLAGLQFETPSPGHARGVVVGISPHATYTAGRDLYAAASDLGESHAYRLCTHAAETPEELRFLRDGTGIYAEHARHYQYGDEDIARSATGLHPIDHLEPYLRQARWMLAHCNYVDDGHIKLLKRTGTSVAYCPVASAYFGHTQHRYRDMLAAGINVCLGTDSMLCQSAGNAQPMSMLAQMRHLYRRDRTDPSTLLAMATINGMHAMEFSDHEATLGEGAPAIFATVRIDPPSPGDPLVQALESDEPVVAVSDSAFA